MRGPKRYDAAIIHELIYYYKGAVASEGLDYDDTALY
jgi:hypothetical protein